MEIKLTKGKVAFIDDSDFHLVSTVKSWQAHRHSHRYTWYARGVLPRRVDPSQKYVLMHRLIIGDRLGIQVDHVNGDGLDNRRGNLRFATPQQNAANQRTMRSDNTSGFKGVTLHKQKGKWQAQLSVMGKNVFLGLFNDPRDAALAYNEAAKNAFGEFAAVNTMPGVMA